VTWKYLQSNHEGDHYEVHRIFPVGEPNETLQEANIVFKGEPITIFKDEVQQVIMRTAADH